MGKIIRGYWDCNQCGNKEIEGNIRACPNCSKARDLSTVFYMKEKNYLSEEESKTVSKNPNWCCDHCNQLNPDEKDICISCGNERNKEDKNYFELKEENQIKLSLKENENKIEPILDKKNVRYFLLGFGLLAIIITVIVMIATATKTVTVKSFKWEKTQKLDIYQTVEESDWMIPKDATLLYTQSEVYAYDHVIDHYKIETKEVPNQRISGYHTEYSYVDLGNGNFEEISTEVADYETYYETVIEEVPVYVDIPIYKDKYYYTIDKWCSGRDILSHGENKNDFIGSYELAVGDEIGIGREKVGNLIEIYYVIVLDEKDKTKTYIFKEKDWTKLSIGDVIEIKVDLLNQATLVY